MQPLIDGFHPSAAAILYASEAFLACCGQISVILYSRYSIRQKLIKLSWWSRPPVRTIVREYNFNDWNRLARLTMYLLAGVVTNFLPPPTVHQVRDFVEFALPAFFFFGITSEVIGAWRGFIYRLRWLRIPLG